MHLLPWEPFPAAHLVLARLSKVQFEGVGARAQLRVLAAHSSVVFLGSIRTVLSMPT